MERYDLYLVTREQGVTKHGGRLEWQQGCNGRNHADILLEVFLDAFGNVVHAKTLAEVTRGACPRTGPCSPEYFQRDIGWFSLEPPTCQCCGR